MKRDRFETLFHEGEKPEAFQYLLDAPNVILTPHIAGWTFESHEKLAQVIADKIKEKYFGKPQANLSDIRVTGIGGVFFKSQNPKELVAWYGKHLGLKTDVYGSTFGGKTSRAMTAVRSGRRLPPTRSISIRVKSLSCKIFGYTIWTGCWLNSWHKASPLLANPKCLTTASLRGFWIPKEIKLNFGNPMTTYSYNFFYFYNLTNPTETPPNY
jgi:hypothetical protein